ncbi:IS110 family transposase [Amycolatopsis pithecellobii]|uniref:IS110 family transposase n=1 Tax=Amycolatopsis pithecellobii TaxID=664692 RepID=UPI0012B807CA|nr:IS110 family transposase [Amycolatopsis pithecellobii]
MRVERAWAGVDIGKGHHHVVVIDAEGTRMLSRRVNNDETVLLELIGQVTALADEVRWAVDVSTGGAALLPALLVAHGQQVFYLSGSQVNRAAGGYRGEGKTDAKDAAIIADQVRMRRDLTPLRVDNELIVELRMLIARRRDLAGDRVRLVNRLHEQLLGISPALERFLDLTNRGPLVLLTHVQTPAALRQLGAAGLEEWLRTQKVRNATTLAATVATAAGSQQTTLPGERLAAQLVADMAKGVIALDEQLKHTDKPIEGRFRRHRHATVLLSMPGIGTLLGAEFLAATGGDLTAFASADHLAGYADLAPAPRDSGRISGNLHRPRRYHRGLQRALYTSALVSIRYHDASRIFYDRKRSEGKRHTQTVLALARRRVNVVWALLRDQRCFEPAPPQATAA